MIRSVLFAAVAMALAACAAGVAPSPRGDGMTAGAPADPSLASPPQTRLKGYLKPGDLDGVSILGPPPAVDSARGQADRAAYLETRALAGSPRWTEAQKDNDLWYGGALRRYACALGAEISAQSTPATLRLLERVELDTRTVGSPAKGKFNRPRPLIGDERPICVPREEWMKTNGSYPSGHANIGWAWGLILGEIAPDRASALIEAGKAVGDSRTICGVHYPSDVEAGRLLGSAMVARLHAEPEFLRDLAAAKREIAQARPLRCAA